MQAGEERTMALSGKRDFSRQGREPRARSPFLLKRQRWLEARPNPTHAHPTSQPTSPPLTDPFGTKPKPMTHVPATVDQNQSKARLNEAESATRGDRVETLRRFYRRQARDERRRRLWRWIVIGIAAALLVIGYLVCGG